MDQQECAKCRRKFTPKPGPGRPRKRCESCRPPEPRRASQAAVSEPTRLHMEPVAVQPPRAGLVATVEQALTKAGRDDTPEGAIALRLAETLADGGHTASGIAALAKELRATVESALKGAETASDGVDELKARRERRRGA